MYVKWTGWFPRIRRWFSRGELARRILKVPRVSGQSEANGLILIQIDGLSKSELELAITDGRVPFLRRLLRRERYRIHTMYSGVPSTTPSVQAELFYGVRCAVPAFSYRSSALKRAVIMAEPEAAEIVETKISKSHKGLLDKGSAYCDVYSGGASETHFCAQNLGWGGFVRSVSPIRILMLVTLYAWSLVRAIGLAHAELFLALRDFVTGNLTGSELWHELLFIPSRVSVGVLLRELVAAGVALDIARGVPRIHCNFLGYDEQAHRRGPNSKLARWSLRGIDRVVGAIWKAAHRSPHRHYDVWIYSDHGQEATTPYEQKFGRTIQEAIERVVSEIQRVDFSLPTKALRHPGIDRSRWIGGGRIARALFDRAPQHAADTTDFPAVVANGPIGLIYLSHDASEEEIGKLARTIVDGTGCPIVLTAKADGTAIAHGRSGEYVLPEQASSVLGEGHPFLREAAEDLVRLVHHPDSGDLVLSGWNPKGESLSFALQHGAHGGPGATETNAFILAPPDTQLEAKGANVLRPNDLRNAGLAHLREHKSSTISKATEPINTNSRPRFRMLTYNVHSCIGMDNRLSPARIARVIARSQADVVALQELDVVRKRTGHIDQAHEIARHLEMEFHFHPAWSLEEELYGDAILSRYPMRLVKAGKLPNSLTGSHEPRGALWVEIMLGEYRIQIINTHLAVNSRIHAIQAEELAGQNWLESALERGTTILCGDFNFGPRSPHYKRLCEKLSDSQNIAGRPSATWFSWKPVRRIDHIMISRELDVTSASVWADQLARQASDHLPLVVDLQLKVEGFSSDINATSEYVALDSNAS